MNYNFTELKNKIKETEEWMSKEITSIRTGRATPAVLDGVKVDSYGSKVALSHTAGVSIEDPKTIRVTPWDRAQILDIENAINSADLGLSVMSDDNGIRVIFPELTSERREALIKVVKAKYEEARISLRGARDDAWGDIQKKEKKGEMSEDDKFSLKDELQKMIDESNLTLSKMVEKKEQELKS